MSPNLYNLLIGILQYKLKEEKDSKEKVMEMLFAPNEDSRTLAWVLIEGLELLNDADLILFVKNLQNSNGRYYLNKNTDNQSLFNFQTYSLTQDWSLQFWDIEQLSPLIKFWKNINMLTISMDIPFYWGLRQRINEMGRLKQLPNEIKYLQNLVFLQIARMPLEQLPPSFSELKQLEKIIITNALLTELPPKIENLQKLKTLVLSNNQLTSLPKELSQLKKLQVFEIKGNPLQLELIPEILFDEKRSPKAIAKTLRKFFGK